MTFAPCCTKSSCKARMNFSLSLLRLPSGRPFGLPDWPGCHCGADGLGRGMRVDLKRNLVPVYGTTFKISERSENVNDLGLATAHKRARWVTTEVQGTGTIKHPNNGLPMPFRSSRRWDTARRQFGCHLPGRHASVLQSREYGCKLAGSLHSRRTVGRGQSLGGITTEPDPPRFCRRESVFGPLADLLALMLGECS